MERRYGNVYMKRFIYFNVYVIRGEDGDILIDTGFKFMRRRLRKWLDKFNIKLVILTHAHVDHTWNANYLKQIYNCKIALSKDDIKYIDNSKIDTKPLNNKLGWWAKIMNYGMKKFKSEPFEVDVELNKNQDLDYCGLPLKIVSLRGHTDGSIGVLYNDYLFAGDALVYRGKYATAAYQNQDNENALKSVEKIIKMNPKLIFVGHDKMFTVDKIRKSNYTI